MLTPKQNMLEVIKGGNPDRFVNQYEAVQLLFSCNLARFLFLFLFLFLGLFFIRLFLFWKKKIEFRNAQELKDFCNLYLEEVWKFNVFS